MRESTLAYWVQTHFRLRHDGYKARRYNSLLSSLSEASIRLIKMGDHEISGSCISFGSVLTRRDMLNESISSLRRLREA